MNTESITTKGEGVPAIGTKMDEDDMDQLVQRASVPNLAALFKKGKESGLIQAGQEYGSTT